MDVRIKMPSRKSIPFSVSRDAHSRRYAGRIFVGKTLSVFFNALDVPAGLRKEFTEEVMAHEDYYRKYHKRNAPDGRDK